MSEEFHGVETNRYRPGRGDFDLVIETPEHGIDGKDSILGDMFSAAVVMPGSSVVFMRMFEMLPASDLLSAYADRGLPRPACHRALELNRPASQ